MAARLIYRAPGARCAVWTVKYRGARHAVLAPSGSEACMQLLTALEVDA